MALTVSLAVAYFLAEQGWIDVNGQSQGIASILVVGAATDYGLLLVARYREELRREESKYTAMRVALRQSWEPILASGGTVILGVLCLLFSDLGSNRGLGPISAVCIAFAMLAALTFLPAAAACCSAAPRSGRSARRTARSTRTAGAGSAISTSVGRRPGRYLLGSAGALVVLALFLPTFDAGGHPAVRGRARRLGVRRRARRRWPGTTRPAPPAPR